ncbi:Ankyrin repeat domain-containing protein 54 [Anthophora retusa]
MTSMDSGIETSNNSDDSSIAQNEDRSTNEINVNSAVATITSTENDICEIEPNTFRTKFGHFPYPEFNFPMLPLDSVNRSRTYHRIFSQKNVREIENSTSTKNSRSIVQPIDTSKIVFAPQLSTGHRKMQSVHAARKDRLLSMFGVHSYSDERRMRIAAATNNTIMMRRLLSCGVTPNNCDIQGRTPLHIASSRGYTEIVRLLLEHGADSNFQDCVGNTPLHLAAATCQILVIALLVNTGTSPMCLNQDGYSPVQLVQTKLKLLQNCSKDKDTMRMKEEFQGILRIYYHMLGCVRKHKDAPKKLETLCNFYSRLSLSNTTVEDQDDVKEFLGDVTPLRCYPRRASPMGHARLSQLAAWWVTRY